MSAKVNRRGRIKLSWILSFHFIKNNTFKTRTKLIVLKFLVKYHFLLAALYVTCNVILSLWRIVRVVSVTYNHQPWAKGELSSFLLLISRKILGCLPNQAILWFYEDNELSEAHAKYMTIVLKSPPKSR